MSKKRLKVFTFARNIYGFVTDAEKYIRVGLDMPNYPEEKDLLPDTDKPLSVQLKLLKEIDRERSVRRLALRQCANGALNLPKVMESMGQSKIICPPNA